MKEFLSFKKIIFVLCLCLPFCLKAQTNENIKANWQNLDLKNDDVFGISTEKTYDQLLKDKKHVPVVVAVIDGGVDTGHEDLKNVIWNNKAEIAGNHTDDDKNGYVDDIHGWDFIGSAKGDVQYDNLELVRFIRLYNNKYANADTSNLRGSDLTTYNVYRRMRQDFSTQQQKARRIYDAIYKFNLVLNQILANLNKTDPDINDISNYEPANNEEEHVKRVLIKNTGGYRDFTDFREKEVNERLKYYKDELDYKLNVDFDPRGIVGDDYTNSNEHFYGNNDVMGPDAKHGTHVAGIIGADRNNNIGVKGVANDVMIMSVRTIPDGDERDKDVANAIRYATANGAKVINMSFGKDYSYNKKVVDDAVKFAMSKDVLIIHAAGNDNKNTDVAQFFPNRNYADSSGVASAWIEVGASGLKNDETLKASFSNYGKTTVDVFAPGVKINSTTPNSTYAAFSGTSMAAPVVTGLAALIRSYYPNLSAVQVKDIILKSVVKVKHKVNIEDGQDMHKIAFTDLCNTGGIVNAYNALTLAATY